MTFAHSYQDIFLIPQYSKVHSRSEISTELTFGHTRFKLPIVPANMKCCMDEEKAKWFSENGYFYVMHRFLDIDPRVNRTKQSELVQRMHEEDWHNRSISLGVQDEDLVMLQDWFRNGWIIDYITVDIAHAHSVRAKEAVEAIAQLKRNYDFSKRAPFIIVGNVATPEACVDVAAWGADAVKVGIAQGGACTTYGKTGFGVPMYTCIQLCAQASPIPIIADGGIKTNGDIAKALHAGGTMVMAGSLFAACVDSPAEDVKLDTMVTHKKYFGSASAENKHSKHHIEGTTVLLPLDQHTYAEKLIEMQEDLQSAISYAGGLLPGCPWGVR